MSQQGSFGRRTWDRNEYERMAHERHKQEHQSHQRQTGKSRAKIIDRAKLNFESNLNKRQVITGQVGGMRGEGVGFRCELCDLRFKDNLKFADHLNSPQHMMNSGEKMVEPATLEQVKAVYDELVRRKTSNNDTQNTPGATDTNDSHDEDALRTKRAQNHPIAKDDDMSKALGFNTFGSTKK